ncbi:MAG: hypothetical protein D6814_01210, partial [Calditrichaeota bacterium]
WIDSIALSDGINFKAPNMEMAARATLGSGQRPISVNALTQPGPEQGGGVLWPWLGHGLPLLLFI